MKSLSFNLRNTHYDSINKFNLYTYNKNIKFNHLIYFIKLNINDSNFFRDFFLISKLFHIWFNLKISILSVIKEKKKYFNKGKTSLMFFFGCNLRNKNFLNNHLDYIYNILLNSSKKIDGSLKYKKLNNGFIYFFSNLNHLLGFKSDRFFNLNIKINLFFNFVENKNNIKNFNYKIIKFYEKVFF